MDLHQTRLKLLRRAIMDNIQSLYRNYLNLTYVVDKDFNDLSNFTHNKTDESILFNLNDSNIINYQREELGLIFNFLSVVNSLKDFMQINIKNFCFTDDFIRQYNSSIDAPKKNKTNLEDNSGFIC